MKRSFVIITIMVLASMTGCLVSSLHPFFKEKDKIYDPILTGTWIDGDSCIWTIELDRFLESVPGLETNDSTYNITFYEDRDSKSELMGTLFILDGVTYVDFIPDPDGDNITSDMASWHHIPVHTLARVQYNSDSILLYWFAEEWLTELFEENRIRIKHETVESGDYARHVLTASTDDLQKFIKKYVNGPKMAGEVNRVFATGYTDDQDGYGVFLKLKPYDGPLPSAPGQVQVN